MNLFIGKNQEKWINFAQHTYVNGTNISLPSDSPAHGTLTSRFLYRLNKDKYAPF